jgi:DNA-binding IscR family transcriptional regulator
MPAGFAQRLLDQLVKAGLLYRTNEPVQGYVPSTDGANISLADISQAVSSLSYGRSALKRSPKITAVFEKIRQMLAQYTLKDVLEPFSKETAKPQESQPPQDQTSA